MTIATLELRRRARQHYGIGYNARQLLRAYVYLRSRQLWVLDKGTPAKFHSARLA